MMDNRLRIHRTGRFISKTKLFSGGVTTSANMSSVGIFPSFLKHETNVRVRFQTPVLTKYYCKQKPPPPRSRASLIGNNIQAYNISVILRQFVITILCLTMMISSHVICQQNLCPKSCTCDEQNLETICKENGGFKASGIPHTLNPSIKRMIINNAQTSQFMGLDSWLQLETLDLAFNKISMIDFKEISKNVKLISLNTSHNNIVELRDSAITDKGISPSVLHDFEADVHELRSLTRINVIELILNHNNLTTLRNLTFLRWHKLQRLDLSYNYITWLDTHSLVGLNRLETINLRGNRLTQVPGLALQGTVLSLSNWVHSIYSNAPSSIRILDLSENELTSINSDSFNMLERLQEIYLESCSLHYIQEGAFNSLSSLNTLSLDNNSLQEIPSQSFTHLNLLKKISLNANNFTHIRPNSFNGLFNLEELLLNNGSFIELPSRAFNGLSNLKKLELGFNPNLTRIERGTFEYLVRLKHLSLNSNALAALPNEFRERLLMLDLRRNPLYCGCDLKWLTRWLKQFNETNATQQPYAKLKASSNYHDRAENSVIDKAQFAELINLKCSGPPALIDKLVIELVENKLECLEPTSDLNVNIGYAMMVSITVLIIFICLLSFCKNKKHLFLMLKENLAQNHITMMLPYSQNLHKNVDDLKKETQLYGSDYEPIGCNQNPIYNLAAEQAIYYEPHNYSQYI